MFLDYKDRIALKNKHTYAVRSKENLSMEMRKWEKYRPDSVYFVGND